MINIYKKNPIYLLLLISFPIWSMDELKTDTEDEVRLSQYLTSAKNKYELALKIYYEHLDNKLGANGDYYNTQRFKHLPEYSEHCRLWHIQSEAFWELRRIENELQRFLMKSKSQKIKEMPTFDKSKIDYQIDSFGEGTGHLSFNDTSDDAAQYIAKRLFDREEHMWLHFHTHQGREQVGSDGAGHLSDLISEENSGIVHISLADNKIGDDGAKYFAKALKTNGKLAYLNLRNTGISDCGARELARALRSNFSLVQLNLRGNNINPNIIEEINELLRTRHLRKKDLLAKEKVIVIPKSSFDSDVKVSHLKENQTNLLSKILMSLVESKSSRWPNTNDKYSWLAHHNSANTALVLARKVDKSLLKKEQLKIFEEFFEALTDATSSNNITKASEGATGIYWWVQRSYVDRCISLLKQII